MTAPTSKPGFTLDEVVFASLLTHINCSEERIFALTRLALRHLSQSAEVWAAVRKALVAQAAAPPSASASGEGLEGARNRALWALVDALMRGAPHVFLPLITPRLGEYVVHQMPWASMTWGEAEEGEAGRSARWWEALVLSWQDLLPASAFEPLRRHLLEQRSGAALDGAVAAAAGVGLPAKDDGAPANEEDLQLLQEEWHALKCLCAESASALSRERLLDSLRAVAAAEAADPVVGSHAAPSEVKMDTEGTEPNAPGESGGNDDEDDEYVPTCVSGAKPLELPSLALPPPRRRREVRPRLEEDDL